MCVCLGGGVVMILLHSRCDEGEDVVMARVMEHKYTHHNNKHTQIQFTVWGMAILYSKCTGGTV